MLELAKYYQKTWLQIKDIAQRHTIPQHYLEQLLVLLKRARLVQSQRGAQGGYSLSRHPSQITIKEVLTCLEGDFEFRAVNEDRPILNRLWGQARSSIEKVFDISLEAMLLEEQRISKNYAYQI